MVLKILDLENARSRAESIKKHTFSKNAHSWAEKVSKPFFFKKIENSKIRKFDFQILFYGQKVQKKAHFLPTMFYKNTPRMFIELYYIIFQISTFSKCWLFVDFALIFHLKCFFCCCFYVAFCPWMSSLIGFSKLHFFESVDFLLLLCCIPP